MPSVTWTLISAMALSSGVVKLDCVTGAEGGGKRGEIILEDGGERKGVMHPIL